MHDYHANLCMISKSCKASHRRCMISDFDLKNHGKHLTVWPKSTNIPKKTHSTFHAFRGMRGKRKSTIQKKYGASRVWRNMATNKDVYARPLLTFGDVPFYWKLWSGQKQGRIAPILTILGPFESSWRDLESETQFVLRPFRNSKPPTTRRPIFLSGIVEVKVKAKAKSSFNERFENDGGLARKAIWTLLH